MTFTSAEFANWSTVFVKKTTYIGMPKTECGYEATSVQKVLDSFKEIKLINGNVEMLRRNALYACYQAQRAQRFLDEGGIPPSDKLRKENDLGLAALKKAIDALDQVATLLKKHEDVMILGLGFPNSFLEIEPKKKIGSPSEAYRNTLFCVEKLLAVARKIDHPEFVGLLNPYVDDGADPFLLYNRKETRSEASGPKPNVIEVGLIFHLAYLFRYYTGGGAEQANYIYPRDSGEFVFEGPMLRGGEPCMDLVTPLFNATFHKVRTKSASTELIRDKLKTFLRIPTDKGYKAHSQDHVSEFKEVFFHGWFFE